MAIIRCSECGNEVSDTAQNCPNCGADIQQQIFDSLSPEEQREVLAPRERARLIYAGGLVVTFLGLAINCFVDEYVPAWKGVLFLLLALIVVIVYVHAKKGNLERW